MRLVLGLSLTAGLLGAYLLASAARLNAEESTARKDRKPMASAHRTPVLVELFTSEGCSSCPPADAELARLVRDQPLGDVEIIPLSEHVDYWNNIGWKDSFSSAAFSARQNAYGRAFRLDSVYTPQMVVDGRTEFVGSDGHRAAVAIRSAAAARKATVVVQAVGSSATIAVSGAKGRGDVMLALTEDGLTSTVRAGENSGRRLAHVAVVRSLRRIGSLDAHGAFQGSASLNLDKGWKRDEMMAVAFVQEPGTRRILGVGQSAVGG